MAGIYFIAAGGSTKNREKSLEKGLQTSQVAELLAGHSRFIFLQSCEGLEIVHAWAANRMGKLSRLAEGDYVVDVKNKKVVQVFQFICWVETQDTRLQDAIGWDAEKPKEKRRPYRIVYFLKNPARTIRSAKSYFQSAFAQEANQNWLVGQRWFSPEEVQKAMLRKHTGSIEELLGIETDARTIPDVAEEPAGEIAPEPETYERPPWLEDVILQIEELKKDPQHQERDHEDLVVGFFERLGYRRSRDIKLRRGYVDISVKRGSELLIVIEVKRDWSLTRKSKDYIQQAFNYALDAGSRFVIVTNGDRYLVFDRTQGLSYDDHLISDFQLTELRPARLGAIDRLRPGILPGSENDKD